MPPRKRVVPSLPTREPEVHYDDEPSAEQLDDFVRGRGRRPASAKPFLYEPSAEEMAAERAEAQAPKGRSSRAPLHHREATPEELEAMFGPDHETPTRRPVNVHETPTERPPDAPRALVTRAGGRVMRRTTVHFRADTYAALEAHCRAEGDEVSRVVDRAVREYLARSSPDTATPGSLAGTGR